MRKLINIPFLLWAWVYAAIERWAKQPSLGIVIFSKDRPLQLDALLRSLRINAMGGGVVTVLYNTSDGAFQAAYDGLSDYYKGAGVRFVKEKTFRQSLIDLLENLNATDVAFLVDDILFVRPFDFSLIARLNLAIGVPSLRLGPMVTYSQTSDVVMRVPELKPDRDGWLRFSWLKSCANWAMPLSVDGNVFLRREFLCMLKLVSFKAPNSLEKAIGQCRFWFKYRLGLCRPDPVLLNFALNRVQSENEDFACGEYSSEYLLKVWQDGGRLDIKAMSTIRANSCHVVCEPIVECRNLL